MNDLREQRRLQKQPNKLDDHPLIPEADFHKKLTAIFSVPKSELDEHIRNNPDPPQKRGRKPKPKTA